MVDPAARADSESTVPGTITSRGKNMTEFGQIYAIAQIAIAEFAAFKRRQDGL